ncbi:MAG: hypothetical protein OXQ29_05280 [Rhodospirillaceae bacterium]|nr:hypothetical protein [Rhodospirillaceae bacterium]
MSIEKTATAHLLIEIKRQIETVHQQNEKIEQMVQQGALPAPAFCARPVGADPDVSTARPG